MGNKIDPEVVKAIMVMQSMHKEAMTQAAADMLLEDLVEYPPQDVINALRTCRRELSRFPVLADIIKRIPGQETNTQEIVGRILDAITTHGYTRPREARKEIGETAWRAVNYFGGWQMLCDFPADSPGTLRAQLRDAVQSSVEVTRMHGENFGLLPATERTLHLVSEEVTPLEIEEVNNWLRKMQLTDDSLKENT